MDFDLSPAERAFRDELRAWLRANRPAWSDGDDVFRAALDIRAVPETGELHLSGIA